MKKRVEILKLSSATGGIVAVSVIIVMCMMVCEDFEAVELFVGICTKNWQECGGWINCSRREPIRKLLK